jgi:hypothetical protein
MAEREGGREGEREGGEGGREDRELMGNRDLVVTPRVIMTHVMVRVSSVSKHARPLIRALSGAHE